MMIDIRPATDLRDNFSEIERTVKSGNTVCLTENGYGSMILLSYKQYAALLDYTDLINENEEELLDECDRRAESCTKKFSHEEMHEKLRRSLHGE